MGGLGDRAKACAQVSSVRVLAGGVKVEVIVRDSLGVVLGGVEGVVVVYAPPYVAGACGGWGSPKECELGDVVGVCGRMSAVGVIALGVKVEIFVRDSVLGLCMIRDKSGVVVSAPHPVAGGSDSRFAERDEGSPVGLWSVEGEVAGGKNSWRLPASLPVTEGVRACTHAGIARGLQGISGVGLWRVCG